MEKTNIDFPPIRPLHPRLKKCACGLVGTKDEVYRHLEVGDQQAKALRMTKEFWTEHGEIPFNEGDEIL